MVLFSIAGLDPANAPKLDALNALTDKLSFATNAIAKAYLDGVLSREEAVPLMQKYYLVCAEKSEQRLRFVEKYRTTDRKRYRTRTEGSQLGQDSVWMHAVDIAHKGRVD